MSNNEKQPGITEHLIDQVRELSGAALPEDALEAARNSVMDWMGVTIAGADDAMVHSLIAAAREQGGNREASVFWHGERTSAALAALVNGSASDSLDFADSNQNMRGHSTPAVVATAFAMAESRKLSGLQFLRGVIAGVEAECRVGLLVQKGLKPGFHPTGNIAPFGAAAAAAWLRDLPADRWPHALGVVATQASGLHNSGGTMSKPFHSGKAAMNGVLSASLAAHGFNGRHNAIEASEGFLSTHSDSVGEELMRAADGRYLILDTTFKTHAACGLTHDTIDNILQAKRERGLSAERIKHIDIDVPVLHLRVCNIQLPVTGLQAKFSLRAVAAMAMLGDDTTDINAYTAELAARTDLVALRDRIAVNGREELKSTSVANIELIDGTRISVRSDGRKPSRDQALKREAVSRKFMLLVAPVLGAEAAERLRRNIVSLHELDSVKPLIDGAARQTAAAA
ncbi:MAG: MmgE/PrpD family protein [Burkholderiales bacterium]